MLILYRILTFIILVFTPLILIYRLIIKKEDFFRFKEKFCFSTKNKKKGKIIWFHGASVGELQSIVPLIEIYEKDQKIKQILITSNTLSSSKIVSNFKFKKVVHQFYPLDINYFTKKFINYWSPSIVFFIDSEIWPNMILGLKEKQIPTILLNARITKKTFKKWMFLEKFAQKIFKNFDLCLASNNETKKYLKKLGSQKIKYIGNLKYTESNQKIDDLNKNIKKFIKTKKVWCASSTHNNEEELCGVIHKKLKKRYKNLLTIIIPRHVDRVETIKEDLGNLNLKIHLDEPNTKINKDTDIYLVNSYGKTKPFYINCKNIFLGGSIINHGGQNPLEAARLGCNILHGKNVFNFTEIYQFLNKNKISHPIGSISELEKKLISILSKKNIYSNTVKNKIFNIGKKILKDTYKEINFFLN